MSSTADSRWRVHPLGRAATLRRAAAEAVLWVLIGLIGLFAVVLLAGILMEEVFPRSGVGTTIDLVSRASVVWDLVIGVLGLLALGLLRALEGPLTARALAAAVHRGAPATEVPIPSQWRTARTSSARTYRLIAIWLLAILGLCHLIVLIALIESGLDAAGLAVIGGGLLLLAAIGAGIPLTGTVFTRWQSRHSELLPQRWTQAHRIVASGRELTEEEITAARSAAGLGVAPPGAALRGLERVLTVILTLAAMAAALAVELLIAIAHPGTTHTPSRRLGERAELPPDGERLVDQLATGMGIAGGVVLFALLGAAVCTILRLRLEHRVLRDALADPGALGVTVLGVLLASVLDARRQRLRDELVQRWPVREDDAA